MSDGMNVGGRRPSPPIPGIGKAIEDAKDLAEKAAKKAKGIHAELSEAKRHPALEPAPLRPREEPEKAEGDASLADELERRRLAGHLRGAKSGAKSAEGTTARAQSSGLGELAGQIGDAIADGLAAAKPERERNSFRWATGPWVKIETIADDETPEAHRNRIGDPAKRGKVLVGIEAGLARLFDIDIEAMHELGRGYLSGAVDFGKIHASLFVDGNLKGVDFELGEGFEFDRPAVGGMIGGQVLGELVGAHYEVGYDTPTVTMLGREVGIQLTARLDAAVHAYARTWVEVTIGMRNAASIGGEAFAGASATLSGQAELAPFADIHGSGSVRSGVGAGFVLGASFDIESGEFDFENSAGAVPAVGFSYDWGVSVNVWELGKFLLDHGRMLENALPHLQETGDDVSRILGDFFDAMSGTGEISRRVWNLGLEVGGDMLEAGGDVVGAALSSGGNPGAVNAALSEAAGDVAESVGDAAATVFGWFVE
jgi:hypothetical protein